MIDKRNISQIFMYKVIKVIKEIDKAYITLMTLKHFEATSLSSASLPFTFTSLDCNSQRIDST